MFQAGKGQKRPQSPLLQRKAEANLATLQARAEAKLTYVPSEPFSLKRHPGFDEPWVEKQIKQHPEILELGSTKVLRSQVRQKNGGVVDLLLKDDDNEIVYTVELMLGAVDASHIVRTIDYFLREQTRSETEDWTHVAVLVAEDIRGSRFLNVVEYLSKRLPLIVIELSALRVGDYVTLKSVRLFDGTQEREAILDEQEDYTREYWLKKSSTASVELVEKFFKILQEFADDLRLTYKKHFIGIAVGNRAENFLYFNPKQDFVRVTAPQISDTAEWKSRLAAAGFKLLEGGEGVRFRVFPQQFDQHRDLFIQLFNQTYKEWFE